MIPDDEKIKDPFHEPYASDQPKFDIAATDPMRLKMRMEILKHMGIDANDRIPVVGGVRVVFDPTSKQSYPVKVDAAYADAFDGSAEDGEGLRAIWSPGENKWIRDNGSEEKKDWAHTISRDWT
jgi:hypothetical protein